MSDQHLIGSELDDVLNGGDGNDHIEGLGGNDTLVGGAGDDLLEGGIGSDVYEFGSGVDTIVDGANYDPNTGTVDTNRVVFTSAVLEDVTLSREGDYLIVQVPTGTLHLAGFGGWYGTGIQEYQFADGTIYSEWQLLSRGFDIYGTAGDDSLAGSGYVDRIEGLAGNDSIDISTGGDDVVHAGDGDDRIVARVQLGTNDRIDGGEGQDTVVVGTAPWSYYGANYVLLEADTLTNIERVEVNIGATYSLFTHDATVAAGQTLVVDGGAGAFLEVDASVESDGKLVVYGGAGADRLTTGSGDDVLVGGAGADRLDGRAGADSMSGGEGNDTYLVDSTGDAVLENSGEGIDSVLASVSHTLSADVENLTLTGVVAIDATGNELANTITGNTAANVLAGGAGNDLLMGGAGSDSYLLQRGMGYDQVRETSSANAADVDVVRVASDISVSEITVRFLTASESNPYSGFLLDISGTTDSLHLAYGYLFGTVGRIDQVLFADGTSWDESTLWAKAMETSEGNDVVVGSPQADVIAGLGGDDSLNGGSGNDSLSGGQGNDLLDGGYDNDALDGGDGNDVLLGGMGGDSLAGGAGDDRLDGGYDYGNNLFGGGGSDTYVFSRYGGLTYAEDNGTVGDIDTVQAASNVLASEVAVRFSPASSTGPDVGYLGLQIQGLGELFRMSWSSTAGAESKIERVVFDDGTVWTEAELLSKAVQGTTGHDYIRGFSTDDNMTGLEGFDMLFGRDGNDVLDGGADSDQMWGGAGDDVFHVDHLGDRVTENINEGVDTVKSSVSFTLFDNIENLELTGSANITASGNNGDNLLVGNSGDNSLTGGGGNDTLRGGAGNDSFSAGGGIDYLDGGEGADAMWGGDHDDTYIVDNASDSVFEGAGQGIDTVISSVSWTLATDVDNLTLVGVAWEGVGNALANTIRGNATDNALDGREGADLLIGGAGNDLYLVDSGADVVSEQVGEGTDTVQSWLSWTLGINVENLVLSGTAAINGTGNAFDNFLTGNDWANTLTGAAGDDTLDGGAGADALLGGTGDDTYLAGSGDSIVEYANEGTDSVRSASSYTLGANLENLTLTGSANLDGTGNNLDNVLVGNAGNNYFNPKAGNDIVYGLGGDDQVDMSRGGTSTPGNKWIDGGDGIDAVDYESYASSAINADLASGTVVGGGDGGVGSATILNIENLRGNSFNDQIRGSSVANRLYGQAGNDVIDGREGDDFLYGGDGSDSVYGGAGNDWLDGGGNEGGFISGTPSQYTAGTVNADTLVGGTGDDTYVVDHSSDAVIEGVGEGTDTIRSSVSWTLGANLENLTLTGGSSIGGTGNALDNVITGNSAGNSINGGAGDDVLDGRAGSDIMAGGTGDDVYYVDSSGDRTNELSGAGSDTIVSSISWTIGSNLENLVLAGTSAINGTGNSGANQIAGNAAANTLNGAAGNDTLQGEGGNDRLDGGDGNDFLLGGSGADTLLGQKGDDWLQGGAGADELTGGNGRDSFAFGESGSDNADRINGFSSGQDKLQLDDLLFEDSGSIGNFVANDARFYSASGATSGHDASDRVIYDPGTGFVYYDADGSGAGASVLVAVLSSAPTLVATDIVIF